jgi:hypothetical protein
MLTAVWARQLRAPVLGLAIGGGDQCRLAVSISIAVATAMATVMATGGW